MKSLDIKLWSGKFSLLLLAAFCFTFTSCGDEEDPGTTGGGGGETNPIASFQFDIDDSDWRVVSFTNASQNATDYAWDFGDGGTSTEFEPTYTYSVGGTYDVSLTASDGTNSRTFTNSITVTDPNEAIKQLTGETSKTWKLFREGISMSVGPNADDPAGFWPGLSNDGSRPCLYTQEFTFGLDGTYTFNDNGEFWAEFGVFNNTGSCSAATTAEACFEAVAGKATNNS